MSSSAVSGSTIFTGSSQFAADLQQVVTRAVSIASLPIDELNNTKTTMQNQVTALGSLDQQVAALQSATTNLQAALQSSLVSSSTSTTGVVTSNVKANALPGEYSIEVVSAGSSSVGLSSAGSTAVTDPTTQSISASQDFTLSVGGTTTSIHANSTSLSSLVDALNTQAGGSIQATIVNVGGSASPDYRISLKSTTLGTATLGLDDGSGDLISSQTAGTLASYKVNGNDTAITSDSRTVEIAPGLQVQLISPSITGQATTITVKQDSSTIENALSNLATAYNSVVDQLATQHGTTAGALSGQSILNSVSSALQSIGTFSNGTADSSLSAFGITLDSKGKLSVDSTAFESAASSNFSGLISVLGSTTGGGFLQAATSVLNGLEDSTNGILKIQTNQLNDRITSLGDQITDKQARVDQMHSNLLLQLASADASIATMEQQVSYLTTLFQSQRSYATQGY